MEIPEKVNAYGIEIDPVLAQEARINTGREVILGDSANIVFPEKPTLIVGNPPFEMAIVNGVIDQAYETLDYGNEVGFVLPAYYFQATSTVMDYAKRWTLHHDLMPRNMFEGIQKPLMFARFIKEKNTPLVGMFLYKETCDMLSLKKKYRFIFVGNRSSTHLLGGSSRASTDQPGGERARWKISTKRLKVNVPPRPTTGKHNSAK